MLKVKRNNMKINSIKKNIRNLSWKKEKIEKIEKIEKGLEVKFLREMKNLIY